MCAMIVWIDCCAISPFSQWWQLLKIAKMKKERLRSKIFNHCDGGQYDMKKKSTDTDNKPMAREKFKFKQTNKQTIRIHICVVFVVRDISARVQIKLHDDNKQIILNWVNGRAMRSKQTAHRPKKRAKQNKTNGGKTAKSCRATFLLFFCWNNFSKRWGKK